MFSESNFVKVEEISSSKKASFPQKLPDPLWVLMLPWGK
jgi:hypothetical protein